jgi:hypothetical protein
MTPQTALDTSTQQTYLDAYRGRFTSLMRWPQLDEFWHTLRGHADDNWYIYHVGHEVPREPVGKDKLLHFIEEVDALLRKEHDEDYCGIVYADSDSEPSYIKIFDPNNLGVTCGFSEKPPFPGWILSRIPPVELEEALYPPGNRRKWWQRIFD